MKRGQWLDAAQIRISRVEVIWKSGGQSDLGIGGSGNSCRQGQR